MIDCLRGTPDAIDGDLSDWNLEAMTPAVLDTQEQLHSGQDTWDNPEDLSGEFYLLWDDENIYVAVVMRDDKLSVNKTGGDIWNADCVENFSLRQTPLQDMLNITSTALTPIIRDGTGATWTVLVGSSLITSR